MKPWNLSILITDLTEILSKLNIQFSPHVYFQKNVGFMTMVKTTCVIQTPVHLKKKIGSKCGPINTDCTVLLLLCLNTQHKGGRAETGYSHAQSPCELLWLLGICPSSVNFSHFNLLNFLHFNLLLENCSTKLNQTWQEWSLGRGDSDLYKWNWSSMGRVY